MEGVPVPMGSSTASVVVVVTSTGLPVVVGAATEAVVVGSVFWVVVGLSTVPVVVTTDGPSGIRLAAYASLYPCGTALASTWNPALIEEMSVLIGKEMVMKGTHVLLGPGLNIHRDPLCGRNFEYYSEDPLITGKMGAAMVRGIQSQGRSACPKHFACNNQETLRTTNDSRLSERALREIYLKGFESA